MKCPKCGNEMKEILKKSWGLYPLIIVLLCVVIVVVIEKVTGDTLRSIPRLTLIYMGIGSIGIALLWINIRIIFKSFKLRILGVMTKVMTPVLSCVLFLSISLANQVAMALSYSPEDVVLYNGTKVVTSIDDDSNAEEGSDIYDVYINYYQYKNALFYGELLYRERLYGGSSE